MSRLSTYLVFLVLLVASGYAAAAEPGYESPTLLAHAPVEAFDVKLQNEDWRWLRDKKVLVIGTALNDPAPLVISSEPADFEGVTADYAGLLAESIGVDVHIRRYQNRDLALQALKRGELDMLGSGREQEAAQPGLALSHAYITDQLVLVSSRAPGVPQQQGLAGQRLALAKYHTDPALIQALYPKAKLELYPSALEGISAVVFGQADAFVGAGITSSYLIGQNFYGDVHVEPSADRRLSGVGFTLNANNKPLLHIVNQALDAIPAAEKHAIARRWRLRTPARDSLDVDLSPQEQQWLQANPRLRVVVIDGNPPLTFFDQNNVFRGLNADLLEKISQRTHLQFDVVRAASFDEQADLLSSGKADLAPTFQHDERLDELRYTRPYMTNPDVFVSRVGEEEPGSLEEMAGKRLVVSPGSYWATYVRQHYPDITLMEAGSRADQMALVAQNKADATLSMLLASRYMISTFYRDRLRITRTVGEQSAQLKFATPRKSLELYSILDKTLRSFPREELDALSDRWRGEVMLDNRGTQASQRAFLKWLAFATGLLLAAAAWIIYLRRQIQRRETAERALKEQMDFLRVLIDGLPHPIYVRDRQTRMLLCNRRYLEAVGRSRETVVGTLLTDDPTIEPHDARVFEQQYRDVMAAGEEHIQDRQLILAGGQAIDAYHWILPFRDSSGEVNGIIAGWIDISERERLLSELKEAKQEADGANRAKTAFLANMSHELRTPINAVVGMLELAMKKADQGVLDRFAIEVASSAARALLELIGDILDVARIESGRLTLAPQRAAFKALVDEVVQVQSAGARQKKLELVCEFDDQADRDVLIDPVRFKQVLANLLSNAIKFTAKGQVLVSIKATLDETNQQMDIQLLVRDTGIGISTQDQLKLFAPFSQVGNSSQLTVGGSGLGLTICRTLCTMMQGQLNLSSVLGLGTQTEVLLTLPILAPLPYSPPEPVEELPASELQILVVDDYPANRLLLLQQLSYLGHSVKDEQDGAHGLRAWRNHPFDVVITDCNMPVMNGYELAKAIRTDEAASGKSPCLILGFTANAQPDEIDRCLAAGMDDCLFKPISMKELSARLSGVESAFEPLPDSDEVTNLDDEIDLVSLEQLTYGDQESIHSLLQDLLSSNEDDQVRLLKLFSQSDLTGLADLAHRVKGGARIVKAKRLIQCCEQLQADCDGQDAARLTESVDALHQAMDALTQMLTQRIAQHTG
ncbi:transporter substrate-binding domain-containing protein [Pseudomonas sp. L13]|uniref:transporter substrate-binding domain-containing protein n=1 Tax=Pseudomonas sp. L13 TaxID=343985 RepID=UPI00137AAA78|nr:transporter substrate-binding domain-containing protein [Pseudomonas sp. L13]NCE93596.1 hybrid sensor histidine kinase/response regulator [Pseudomonas sp. L13]